MSRSRPTVRSVVALLCGVLALGAGCAPPAAPTAPAHRLRPVRLVRPTAEQQVVAVSGQLLRVGPDAVPFTFRGERRIALRRSGRIYRVNGRRVGLDLTGLDLAAAQAALRRFPEAELVVWRDLDRLTADQVHALSRLTTRRLGLWLGLSLTASAGLDLRHLKPLCGALHSLVLEGEVRWSGVPALKSCTGLRGLRVVGSVPRGALGRLASLSSLRSLDLSGALRSFGPGHDGLRPLRRLMHLVTLDLSDNGLRDPELASLTSLRHLHWLRLRGNPITGATLGRLGLLPRLAWLDLGHTRLTNRGLSRLVGLRALRYLRIADTQVSVRGVVAFRRARRKVQILGREDLAKVELGLLRRTRAGGGTVRRHIPLSRRGPVTVLTGLGRALTGVTACDRYLRLMGCYVRSMPRAGRSAGIKAVKRVRNLWRRQLRRGGSAAKRRLAKTCASSLVYLKRAVRRLPAARRCIRP